MILSQLIDANGLEEGVAKYAERRDTFNGDITLKEKHQKRLKDAYETVMTIPELNTLGGYGETGTANLTTNYSLNSMFHTTLDGFYCREWTRLRRSHWLNNKSHLLSLIMMVSLFLRILL